LAGALGAEVPDNWPPETLVDALPFFLQQLKAAPDLAGWLGWYWLWQRGPEVGPLLVCSGGFKGAPQAGGTVEIGYSVLPQFQSQGYASEAAAGLVAWALARPGVDRVIAETLEENLASRRVLARLGFRPVGPGSEPGSLLFELTSAARSSIIFSMTDGRE
jgi:ribosomal-protein-alanine N-acetyltransferase